MKKNYKITISAMMAALASALMLLSYFPYLTYAIPAIAGLFIMVTVIEIDCKWAFAAYLASAFLVFLFAEIESKLMFIGLLGYYPILKALLERIKKPILEWLLKIAVFNLSLMVVYYALSALTGITSDDFGSLGKYGMVILIVLGNVAFVLYDIAVSRMAAVYWNVFHPKIMRIIK